MPPASTQHQFAEPFDEAQWRQQCDEIEARASKLCGSSYDVYLARVSDEVDETLGYLPRDHRARGIEIARARIDYMTGEEISAMQEKSLDDGWCIHGIDPGCCPAGCGELDY